MFLPYKLWFVTHPAPFVIDPWKGHQIMQLIEVRCAMTYKMIGRTMFAQWAKNPIDLILWPNLMACSSEREFLGTMRVTSFEEAGKLCENIPCNGVWVVPLGHNSQTNLLLRHSMVKYVIHTGQQPLEYHHWQFLKHYKIDHGKSFATVSTTHIFFSKCTYLF